MEVSVPKHFDYLDEHSSDLEAELGLRDLQRNITRWRLNGMDDPESVLVGCRKTIELTLKKLAEPLPDSRMNLRDVIDYCEDEGIFSHSMALKCHEIRRKGNSGAHAARVRAIDAQIALDLLDDFLRWCAERFLLIEPSNGEGTAPSDSIFIIRSEEEIAEVSQKARIAAALDNNRGLERKARAAKDVLEACEDSQMSDLQKMEALIKQAEEIGVSIAKSKDPQATAAQQALFEGFTNKIDSLKAERREVELRFDAVNAEVQEILNEHDFIRKILREGKQATVEQHGVMAFPRGSNSKTNILQIAGGAGTGKTLCLLAKLISEVDNQGQGSLFDTGTKRALFVCFNTRLAKYVRGLLDQYENTGLAIDVESYDNYINQLVRQRPKQGYEHLTNYAADAKYSSARIVYSSNDNYIDLLRNARDTVRARYPNRAKDYYLDPSDDAGFQWLEDELQWIEARFDDANDAKTKYPKARRVGRGTRRQPSEEMRNIILEIWSEFNKLLTENGFYTIDQATKRLLHAKSLPAYDAIAIDEVQDFSLVSIRLLLRFRRSENSRVFISGDENQKIYQRDFTWKELDEGLRGHTITLRKNMRNSSAIEHFSGRLIGADCPYEAASSMVHIVNADEARTIELLRRLVDPALGETAALITSDFGRWANILQSARVPYKGDFSSITTPGLYILGALAGKGLEFDNVVVDYVRELSEDEEEEKRLRYVHFTRARKRLYIRYLGAPPRLLTKYYSDFLG